MTVIYRQIELRAIWIDTPEDLTTSFKKVKEDQVKFKTIRW